MMLKRLSVFTVLAALALTPSYASNINNDNNKPARQVPAADQQYESFAIQMNLDDASADRVFDLGNDIYQSVNGNRAAGMQGLGRLFAVDDAAKVEVVKHKEGLLKGQSVIDKNTGKSATRKVRHNVYLACEQTTASPHATITVYEDAKGGKLTAGRVQTMHKSLDIVATHLKAKGLTGEQGVQLQVTNVVLIASFLQGQQSDAIWMQDACPLRAQKPKRNNVYYRFNGNNELVDEFGSKFTDVKQDLARAFIVLECRPLLGQANGAGMLNELNGVLAGQAVEGLTAKNYPTPLLHVTLAKLAGTKDSGQFRQTSRESLLFPIAGNGRLLNNEAFVKIQDLVRNANMNWKKDSAANGSVLSCAKLVVNPVQVADGQDKPMMSFKPEHKRVARGNTNWTEQPRREVSLLRVANVQPADVNNNNNGPQPQGQGDELARLQEEVRNLEANKIFFQGELKDATTAGRKLAQDNIEDLDRQIKSLQARIKQMQPQNAGVKPQVVRVPGIYPEAFHADNYLADFPHVRTEAAKSVQALGTYAWEHFQKYKPHFPVLNGPRYYEAAAPKKGTEFDAARYLAKWTFVRDEAVRKGVDPLLYAEQHFILNKKAFPNLANY